MLQYKGRSVSAPVSLCETHELFCDINKSSSEALTPINGGDTFGTEHIESHRFSSSGFNLIFEGLLLEATLHVLVEGTHSDPR
jgi:hypothetical protein